MLLLKIPPSPAPSRASAKGLGPIRRGCWAAALRPVAPALLSGITARHPYHRGRATENHAYSTSTTRSGGQDRHRRQGRPGRTKISDEGRSRRRDGMMVGYQGRSPEHSAEAIDAEGWLHTGYMGKLTGRLPPPSPAG